jgi:5-keto-L-gluconate epimerase
VKLSVAVAPSLRPGAPIPLQGPLEWAFEQAREAGYQGVELQIGHPSDLGHLDVGSLLHAYGLEAVCVATGAAYARDGLCLSDPETSRRKAAVERIREHCALAAELNSSVVIGMMRGRLSADRGEADAQRDAFLASLAECAQIAAESGTRLIVEPINRYETNFLPTVESVLALLDDNGLTDVDLMLDTFHMNIEESSIELAFARARGRIGLVQLVDTNRLTPGLGHLAVAPILAVLTAGGYDGFLSIESLPIPSGPEAIRAASAFLGSALRAASGDDGTTGNARIDPKGD